MPRKARILLPNIPHHIVQRGHNRQPVFCVPDDYQFYLVNLAEWKMKLGIKVYCYCLMTNHVHLVLEPGNDPFAISQLMKRLAGRQTRLVNTREDRTGSLWESRFKASPIERDAYLLQCCRYVERNPVRAGMVESPRQYLWSSYHHRIHKKSVPWLDEWKQLVLFGPNSTINVQRYKKLVESGDDEDSGFIRSAVQRNQLTGSHDFVDEVDRRFGLRVLPRAPGRPKDRK